MQRMKQKTAATRNGSCAKGTGRAWKERKEEKVRTSRWARRWPCGPLVRWPAQPGGVEASNKYAPPTRMVEGPDRNATTIDSPTQASWTRATLSAHATLHFIAAATDTLTCSRSPCSRLHTEANQELRRVYAATRKGGKVLVGSDLHADWLQLGCVPLAVPGRWRLRRAPPEVLQ